MSQATFHIDIDKRELEDLQRLFEIAPKKIRGHIKRRWWAQGKKAVRLMRGSHFSGPTGARTLRHRMPRQRKGASGKALRSTLAVKKVKFGSKGVFGGYMVLGFKGLHGEPTKTHPLINIFEFSKGGVRRTASGSSRGRLRTRAPLAAAWARAADQVNLVNAVDDGIDDWIKS